MCVYIYIYIYIYILQTLILWAWFLWFLAGKCRWAGHETINHNEFGGFEAKIESEKAVTRSQTQDTSALSCQCSATESR